MKMIDKMDELITRSTFDSGDTRSIKQQNRNDKAADIRSRAKLVKNGWCISVHKIVKTKRK